MPLLKIIAIVLLLLNGIPAIYGGYMLMNDTTGYAMGAQMEWLQHSPFYDYFIPGLVLLSVNGVGNIIVCMLLLFDIERYYIAAAIAGIVLVLWILIQIMMIQQFSWLQISYLFVGACMILNGRLLYRYYNPPL